jgi:hypothetical protein
LKGIRKEFENGRQGRRIEKEWIRGMKMLNPYY